MFWFFFWGFIFFAFAITILTECLKSIFTDIRKIVESFKK